MELVESPIESGPGVPSVHVESVTSSGEGGHEGRWEHKQNDVS